MLITVKGVITKETPFGEKDKYMTVLTAEYGKISVLGKGIRSIRSEYMAATQPFCYTEFVLYNKNDKYFMREACVIEPFHSVKGDLDNFALGEYFLDVVNEVCVEGEDQSDMLRLLLNSLYALGNGLNDKRIIKAVFEMRVCTVIGLMPNITACIKCGAEKSPFMYMNVMNANIICESCVHEQNETELVFDDSTAFIVLKLSPTVLEIMRYIISARPERLFAFKTEEPFITELCDVSEKYLLHQLGKSFTTLDFYKQLKIANCKT